MKQIKVEYVDRVDKYVGDNSKISRTDIKKLIDAHAVLVNDINVRKPNFKVKAGDVIKITDIIKKEIKAIPQDIPIDVIYEDEDIIIINKASGMVVHPAPGNLDGTLVNALLYRFNTLSDTNGETRPGIVHRIDKDTSGLLVVAKNNMAHQFLAQELKEHKIKRIYWAWVEGRMENDTTHIDLPIGRDSHYRQRMAVQRLNAKHSVSHVFVDKIKSNKSLVKIELETGRTHQIRVHLAYIKHPVIGDPIYGHKKDNFNQRLHAAKLELIHPRTKKIMVFKAPFPKEFLNEEDSE